MLAVRPYNPEGISFIHDIRLSNDRHEWLVDGKQRLRFDKPADAHYVSDYRHGDIYIHLHDLEHQASGVCDAGMLTAAALFKLESSTARTVEIEVPLAHPPHDPSRLQFRETVSWHDAMEGHCRLELPDQKYQFLYDAALRTLVLHSPGDVYPGPYTYKRFWFRDAAFIINALLCAGFTNRAERALDRFGSRQDGSGYFHSQDGEWDSNGEALWIMWRFCQLTHSEPKLAWHDPIRKAAQWIINKRTDAKSGEQHAGLLPAGFSAEHLGPNDYYFWDDFWGVGGLQAASAMCAMLNDQAGAKSLEIEARAFLQSIHSSLAETAARLGRPAMPASPYRRLDAGAIGSLAVGYPLQIFEANDPRLIDTTNYLLDSCFVDGAFFQDMIHSGLNAYLTLHVAQILLRASDRRFIDLIDTVAALASPTGQWPEANHPRSGGGCMGDGQHAWAAAEWILMVRNCFVREERDHLIVGSGLSARWLDDCKPIHFGPAPTPFGAITIDIRQNGDSISVRWDADWFTDAPKIEVNVPGWQPVMAVPGTNSVILNSRNIV